MSGSVKGVRGKITRSDHEYKMRSTLGTFPQNNTKRRLLETIIMQVRRQADKKSLRGLLFISKNQNVSLNQQIPC